MAGDTLRGIGKKELAESIDPPPERATEPAGSVAPPEAAETEAAQAAEAEARPLRSLDDLPSDRTGAPMQAAPTAAPVVVDDAVPLPATPSTPRSGPNRVSFGTMIGHEMHSVQVRIAAAAAMADGDANLRGTAHGREVHLPAHPDMNAQPESAPVVAPGMVPAPARAPTPAPTVAASFHPEPAAVSHHDDLDAFSGGDHSFFDTDPVNDEYEPENTRAPFYRRLAVSGAVLTVVAVVVIAWVHSHSTSEEPAPVSVKPMTTVPSTPPPAARPAAPKPATTAAAPPAPAAPARPAPAPARPAPAPAPVAAKAAPPAAPVAAAHVAAKSPSTPSSTTPAVAPAAPHETTTKAPPPAAAPVTASRDIKPSPPPHPVARDTAHDKKPAPVAAAAPAPKPATAPKPAPAAPKAAPPAPARAAKPEPSRPVARSAAPSGGAKGQKSAPARGKQKYDPDGTLPLSFD